MGVFAGAPQTLCRRLAAIICSSIAIRDWKREPGIPTIINRCPMALGRVICLRAKSNGRDDGTVQSVCGVVQRIYAARGDGILLSGSFALSASTML